MERTQKGRVFQPVPAEVERIGEIVLDAAYKVHTTLGPGLLESIYETCHAYEIRPSGLSVETQVAVPITYADIRLEGGLRLDLLIEKRVIVEIKAVETMNPVFEAQLLTYLRLTKVRLGYLINFNIPHLKDGIKRMVY